MANRHDYTSMGGTGGQFPQTEWTIMLYSSQQKGILTELCTKYWKPLYRYLRCKGFNNEEAKDLVQGFFTEKVIGREFFKRADRTKGKFRNFLLVAMRNYIINIQKKDKKPPELEDAINRSPAIDDAEAEFNRAWAAELLKQILKELETECHRRGKTTHWQIFREWLLEPTIDDKRTEMNSICAKYGIPSASQAYNMISKTKIRFRAILRRNMRSLVDSDAEVDNEILNFINFFSKNSGRI